MTNDETAKTFDRRRLSLFSGIASAVVVVYAVLYLVGNARHSVHETICHSNLVKLRYALVAYDSVHGSLPPATLQDSNGNAAHSWRVLILPYLDSLEIDSDGIYKLYDMAKPWNDTGNHRLFRPVGESRFACPCGSENGTVLTSYVVLIGEDTLFPGNQTISVSDIPNTTDPILVLEITNSDIEWSEPKDLFIDEFTESGTVNSIQLTHAHAGRIRYITLSGMLGILPPETDRDVVRQLASINDQTAIDTEKLP